MPQEILWGWRTQGARGAKSTFQPATVAGCLAGWQHSPIKPACPLRQSPLQTSPDPFETPGFSPLGVDIHDGSIQVGIICLVVP